MTLEYLPLTRLVRSYRDGFALDLIEEHFHCTIDSAHIRMRKTKDCYSIEVRGFFANSFYNRWNRYDVASTLPFAIGLFLDAIDEHIIYVSSLRCV